MPRLKNVTLIWKCMIRLLAAAEADHGAGLGFAIGC
jgi:hypothetical protein